MIQDYKNQGGWNNDWALSQKICSDLGVHVPYQNVVDYFTAIFFGDDANGLILREEWILATACSIAWLGDFNWRSSPDACRPKRRRR